MNDPIPSLPTTLTALLDRAVARRPDGAAILYENDSLTYRAFDQQVRRAAGFLAAQGIGAGDRVAFWLPNTPAYLILYFACGRLGAVAVAVNTRFRAAEVGDIIRRSGARMLVLWPDFRGIDFPGILAALEPGALDAVESVIVYGEGTDAAFELPGRAIHRFAEIGAHAPYDRDHAGPDTGSNIFTTSGTTSAPKLVLHRQSAVAVHTTEVARKFGFVDPDTVCLQALPLCGVFGFCQAIATIAAARPMVLMSAFDAAAAVALCKRHRVTHFEAADDMLDAMLRAAETDAPFATIRFVGYGAFNRALEDLPDRADARGIRVIGLWGMSETMAFVAGRDPHAPLAERRKAGGAMVSPRGAARVRDPDSGDLLPPGKPGALEIAGPSLMVEYIDNPEATAEALTGDGYVCTGDLAQMEEDGGFEFITRMGDVLRLGGFLVSPAEIEAELQSLEQIAAAQVVAVDAAGRNAAFAFVTLATGAVLDETAVRAHCAARLAKFKVPIRI
ncbi:MAG: AMP-binding protein, partial [Alphaproteobacteria bacterium]|nr:AMP-binding protein [Alphaproteobacteria bacterium]